MTDTLDLPTEGKVLTPAELKAARAAAEEVFALHRERYLSLAKGADQLILLDGADKTGSTFTIGEDMVDIEQRHYRRFKKSLLTACFFTLTKD